MTLLIVYAVVAIAISFLCSLLEACLLSLPRSFVEAMAERGSRAGYRLRAMKKNIDRPLAAILTLNTVAHTAGAAGVGAQAAVVFGSAAVGIAGAVMTLLILVLSEIIPKTLGAVHAKALAPAAAVIIRAMIFLCLPLIWVLEWVNRRLKPHGHEERLSRHELISTLRMGHASGAMRPREYTIASNLIALSSIPLAGVLTPRTVVFSLPHDLTVGEAIRRHPAIRFARIPVYAGPTDHVVGYVPRFAIHAAHSDGNDSTTLADLIKPIPVLPDLATVGQTLDTFVRDKLHIALVVNEHGSMAGIVSLEDLLETLLGEEIIDENDPAADMRELARRRRHRH